MSFRKLEAALVEGFVHPRSEVFIDVEYAGGTLLELAVCERGDRTYEAFVATSVDGRRVRSRRRRALTPSQALAHVFRGAAEAASGAPVGVSIFFNDDVRTREVDNQAARDIILDILRAPQPPAV